MTATLLDAPTSAPTLRPYQRDAVEFLHEHPRGALLLDMGLGKTAITLRALTPNHLPVLVSAPPRVAEMVWPVEVPKWRPDLKVVHATGKNRTAALDGTIDADIVAISREQLEHAAPYADRFKTFVMDELSSFKNQKTRRFKFAKKITASTPFVWGLTGTPAPNGLLDLFPQMFLIDRGAALGPHITKYRQRYFTPQRALPSGVIPGWDLRPGAASQIHRKLETSAMSLSTEGRVDLPPVTFNDVEVPLPPKAKAIYKRLKTDLVTDLDILGLAEGQMFSALSAGALSAKLAQISSGFIYPDERERGDDSFTPIHSAKLEAIDEILAETSTPVIIAYRFRAELARLKARYPEARTLEGASTIRQWDAGKVPILLVHPASAGHGLNLQHGGHTMIWMSLTWSLEEYQQTNKRLDRSGQKHPVMIHRLLSPGTVDTSVLNVLKGKDSVQSALLKHLEMSQA